MDAVVERLRQLGGDGLVEEHPGGEARFRSPRLALWMSLKGEIVDEPRLDRYPYLLLEADVEGRKVQVDEGDMWRGAGGNTSRRVGAWDVSETHGPAGHGGASGDRPPGCSLIWVRRFT